MAHMIEKLSQLEREGLEAMERAGDSEALEAVRIAYLGTKGKLREAMSWLKDASKEDKPRLGQGLNALKGKLEEAFEQKKAALGQGKRKGIGVDVTEPGVEGTMGRAHVISMVTDEMVDVFGRMGFEMVEGPEVEDDYHNFEALNIPKAHPARDPLDNFYLDHEYLMRAMTSTVQIRVMEERQPPLRVISPGRVYRPDEHDATHSSMFHQLEGLYVDRGVSMTDLKTTLFMFAKAFFGEGADIRLRPSYFPFTEPSAELDIRMEVKGTWQWVELGGCGMVHPSVFESVGYDPEIWTGYAWGLGIERVAMRRYGIPDIRMLYENDVRFLRQFQV